MIMDLLQWIGVFAAVLTSLSYIPQVKKAWPRGSTKDLSLTMLVVLTGGLLLWLCYGALKGDWIISIANGLGGALTCTVLLCKIRDIRGESIHSTKLLWSVSGTKIE